MIDKPLKLITLDDIAKLVSSRRSEGPTLDFKQAFPTAKDEGTRDFLADVTAFANTDGGDLIIGVKEDGNGVAAELVGIDPNGLDEAVRRVEDQVRSCVVPRVPMFAVQQVNLANGKIVLVMRVGASLIAPHRITFKGFSRFYRRGNRSNYEMSTAELRQAFAASIDLPNRIRDLHRKGVEATTGKDMPCRIKTGPIAALTIAPLSVLREARDINFTRDTAVPPPDGTTASRITIGLDRLITHSPIEEDTGSVRAWTINHRRGYLDFAWMIGHQDRGAKYVWAKYFQPELTKAATTSIQTLNSFGIEGPWIAMLTLSGIRDHRMVAEGEYIAAAAWQDPAYLGEIIDDAMSPEALDPFVQGFWRLFGVENPPKPQKT